MEIDDLDRRDRHAWTEQADDAAVEGWENGGFLNFVFCVQMAKGLLVWSKTRNERNSQYDG